MSDAPNLLLTWLKVDRRSAASLKNMLVVAVFLLASSFTEGERNLIAFGKNIGTEQRFFMD